MKVVRNKRGTPLPLYLLTKIIGRSRNESPRPTQVTDVIEETQKPTCRGFTDIWCLHLKRSTMKRPYTGSRVSEEILISRDIGFSPNCRRGEHLDIGPRVEVLRRDIKTSPDNILDRPSFRKEEVWRLFRVLLSLSLGTLNLLVWRGSLFSCLQTSRECLFKSF